MKKYFLYLIYIINGLFLVSCEKEIDIDYHDADMRYVVEGYVSNTGTTVRISHTQPMDDNTTDSDISNATVTLTADDGTQISIPYKSNGYYTSNLKGVPGLIVHHAAHARDERVPHCQEEHAVKQLHLR